jgi:post-segregation antitoxin (ccd killing protein)
MATTRSTFTLDSELAERARQLDINISAAAREGVAAAVRTALTESDRSAYEGNPEQPDPFWDTAQAWGNDDTR